MEYNRTITAVQPAERIQANTENKFIALKTAAGEEGQTLSILDLSVGEPPTGASEHTFARLMAELQKPENRFYADNGTERFAEAARNYFYSTFSPAAADLEFLPIPGVKSILAMLPAAFVNTGDYCLMPDPAYPVLGTWTGYLGGGVFKMPLDRENSFYPDFDAIPDEIRNKAKLLYLNYPNNPTGQCAGRDFFLEAVDFALKNGILIVHDAAYSEILRPGVKKISIFDISGAEGCAIELHSLSKIRNMTGWRIGFAVGSRHLIGLLAAVKSNTDSGQFIPIQQAAAAALEDRSDIDRLNAVYTERLSRTSALLKNFGFGTSVPPGTFYLYTELTQELMKAYAVENATEFSAKLRREAAILTVPWGTRHIRFSMTFPMLPEGDSRMFAELSGRLKT